MLRLTLLLVIGLLIPVAAHAQTPTADEEDGLQSRILDRADMVPVASAFVNYEIGGLHLDGPALYQFVITTFEDVETADAAFDVLADEFVAEMQAAIPAEQQDNFSAREASPPDLGDAQYAATVAIEQEAWTINYGVVYVRVDKYIVGAAATGIIGNMVLATVPFLESMIDRLGNVDTTTQEGLAEALPALRDMPPGFAVSEDD